MRRTRFPRARVYGSVRSAHLERAHALAPATILHQRWRYDMDPTLAAGLDLVRGRTLSTAVTLARSGVPELEVHEPLFRSGLWRTAVAVTVVRAAASLRRRQVTVGTYAIENRDNYRSAPDATWRRRIRRRTDWLLTRYVARRLDRIVYGTPAAAELYGRLLGRELGGCASTVIPALPAPCTCPDLEPRDPDIVLFVGAFQPRKGLPELVAAWPDVVSSRPSTRLVVMGKGPLEHRVRELVDRAPEVELAVDPPRERIHRAMRRAAVLVLPSQRTSTWREQVGLPIVEGLAHGCSVVTTEETGLAPWLLRHGHEVLPSQASTTDLAACLVRALERRRPRDSVLADLPEVDGRLAADTWLFDRPTGRVRPSAIESATGQRVEGDVP